MINQVPASIPTRERLIAAARGLFAANGYFSTPVAEILQRAGANSGSLYYSFRSKEELLLAVLRTYRDGIDEMLIEPAWRGIDDPIERVFALLSAYRRLLLESDCSYGCPIGSLALEIHEPETAVRRLLVENFDAWKQRVAQCLEQARERGGLEADPEALATLVLSVMEGAVMQSRTYRSVEPFDASVDTLRALLDRVST